MRGTFRFLWLLLSGLSVVGSLHAAQLDSAALLERFRPTLYFEDDGPNGVRQEYPTSYVWDDVDIEDNFAGPAVPASVFCYGQVHEQRDAAGKICWVVEYHFYYPRNWAHFSLGFSFAGYSHEHEWECPFLHSPLSRIVTSASFGDCTAISLIIRCSRPRAS